MDSKLYKEEVSKISVLGENLKKIRKEAGLNIKQLSQDSGVGRTTISEIERGISKNPKNETLKRICSVLNVTLDKLTSFDIGGELNELDYAIKVIFSQKSLKLHGNLLTDKDKIKLEKSIEIAIKIFEETNYIN